MKILTYQNGNLTEEDSDSSNVKRISKDKIKKLVVKSGTSVVTDNCSMNLPAMVDIARQLSIVRKEYDIDVAYVSSGAIGFGMIEDGITERPTDIYKLMQLSTLGQGKLFSQYCQFLQNYGLKATQILVNEHDLDSHLHLDNLKKQFDISFKEKNKIPIINANDATWGYEIKESDNDGISAVIAERIMNADLMIVLSNIDGVYNKNPKDPDAKLISHIYSIDDKLRSFTDGKSTNGTGGAESKFKISENFSGPYIVANGRTQNTIIDILEGKTIGTYFEGRK
ncbi:MAG: glutamate 5-kinase [Nanoarchaeota archaeon]|nr:glutamate 5-kinase [Nanoarchaeota archaeon]